jgi:outer membrane immunogenic protein
MRRLACVVALSVAGGTAALAADLPPPIAPAAYIPVARPYPYDWSGFYIGGNLGAGFSNSDSTADTLASITNSGVSPSSARRPCSIGFPTAKTPST